MLHSGSYIASSSRKSIWCSQSFQTSLPWCTQRGWKSNNLFVWDKTEKDMKNNIGPTCQPSMLGNNHVQHAWKQLCSVWQAALLSLILFGAECPVYRKAQCCFRTHSQRVSTATQGYIHTLCDIVCVCTMYIQIVYDTIHTCTKTAYKGEARWFLLSACMYILVYIITTHTVFVLYLYDLLHIPILYHSKQGAQGSRCPSNSLFHNPPLIQACSSTFRMHQK